MDDSEMSTHDKAEALVDFGLADTFEDALDMLEDMGELDDFEYDWPE